MTWHLESCGNLSTHGPITRSRLNVSCASQVYVIAFEIARFRHCSITYASHLLSSSSFSKLPLISPLRPRTSTSSIIQRYDFSALMALALDFTYWYYCLELFKFSHLHFPSRFLRSPVLWTSRVGRVFLGFFQLCHHSHCLLNLCSSSSQLSLSCNGAYKNHR